MPEIKNPAGSYYIDSDNFKIEKRQTATGSRPVVKLANVAYEIPDLSDKYISTNLKGQPNGVAELDEGGKLMANQLPSGIDKAEEYPTKQDFPEVGQANVIYVDLATNLEYRWSGSDYVQVPTGLAIGTTAETAFRGDHGNELYLATVNGKLLRSNPVLTAKDVGAASVDEVNKPIHTTMAVEITEDGFGGYDAYYDLNPINDEKINAHRNADGVVFCYYYDAGKNTTYVYWYSNMENDRQPSFTRTYIDEENMTTQVVISIDHNAKAHVEIRTAGVAITQDGKIAQNIDFNAHNLTGVQKFSTNGPAPLYIGSTVESKPTTAPRLTAHLDGSLAIVKADTVDEYIPISVGDPKDADHAVTKRYFDAAVKAKIIEYLSSDEGKLTIRNIVASI